MIRVLFIVLAFLSYSCSEKPPREAIKGFLEGKYRLFAEVVDVRILTMVRMRENTYSAQVKYGLRFKKSLQEIDRDITEKLRDAELSRNPAPFVTALVLKELIRKCGKASIERGRTCYITERLELKKIRGEWAVKSF